MPLSKADEVVWQDREVRFDSPPAEMQCRKGEVVIDSINSVEDTKGNNGERGVCEILCTIQQYSSTPSTSRRTCTGFKSCGVLGGTFVVLGLLIPGLILYSLTG